MSNTSLLKLALLVGFIMLAGLVGINLFNDLTNFGADVAFGKIVPTAIADLKKEEEIKYKVGVTEKKDFAKLVKVAEISPRALSPEKAAAIAKNLGFDGQPKEITGVGGSQKYVWQSGGKSLEIDPEQGSISFVDFEAVGERKIVSSSGAEDIARGFLENNELLSSPIVVGTSQLKIEKRIFSKTKKDFNGFEVLFSKKMDSYKVISPNMAGLASVVVGADAKIKRLLVLAPLAVAKTGDYPSKGRNQAVKILSSGKAAMSELTIAGQSYYLDRPADISFVTINNLDLVYIDDGQSKYLQPHYQFKGEATLMDGKKAKVTFLVNAIKDKYLKRSQ